MSKIRVLVVDDHAILRAGLRMLINAQPDMEVLGEATDGHEALRKARELNPDVALMDITMPSTTAAVSKEGSHGVACNGRAEPSSGGVAASWTRRGQPPVRLAFASATATEDGGPLEPSGESAP
jgi:DNA-binding NarL/FixJ family response regulator